MRNTGSHLKSRKYRSYRRKSLIQRYIAGIITFLFTAALIYGVVTCIKIFIKSRGFGGFVPAPYGASVSEKVKKAQSTEIPDWIDEELIDIHSSARTGTMLNDISYIVVHYVGNPGTSAKNNRDYFNKPSTNVSSNFVVGLKGEIIQCLPLYEKSAASNERNKDSISIEVCHPDETGEFNEKTYASLVKLVSWLCDEFSLDTSQIIRHYDVTGKECPKYYVDNPDEWESFKNDVADNIGKR